MVNVFGTQTFLKHPRTEKLKLNVNPSMFPLGRICFSPCFEDLKTEFGEI